MDAPDGTCVAPRHAASAGDGGEHSPRRRRAGNHTHNDLPGAFSSKTTLGRMGVRGWHNCRTCHGSAATAVAAPQKSRELWQKLGCVGYNTKDQMLEFFIEFGVARNGDWLLRWQY